MRIDSPSITGSLIVSSSSSNEHSFMGANVGIGTSSPNAKLEVIGDISGSSTTTGSFGIARARKFQVNYLSSDGTVSNLIAPYSAYINDATSHTTHTGGSGNAPFNGLNIENINTTNDAHASVGLRVATFDSGISAVYGGSTNVGKLAFTMEGNETFVINTSNQISGSAISTGSFGTLALGSSKIEGSIFVGGTLGVGGSQSTAFHVTNTDPIFRLQNGGSYFDYAHTSGNDLELSYNGGSALLHLTNGGNLGINDTTPTAQLDITTSASGKYGLQVNNNSGNQIFAVYNSGGQDAIVNIGNDGGATKIQLLADGNSYFNGGNVGIGTANPSRALHVDGDALVTGILTAQEFHTEFVSASVLFDSGSTKFGDDTADTHEFTGSVFITGSVGIGTTSPSSRVHIKGPDAEEYLIIESTDSGDGNATLQLTNDAGAWLLQNKGTQSDNLVFRRSGVGDYMVITKLGKVGIGHTAAPNNSATLGVAGNINIGNGQSSAVVYLENSGTDMYIEGNASKLNIGSVGNTQAVTFPAGGGIQMNAGNVSGSSTSTGSFGDGRFAGRVGIGTVNPTDYHPDADNLVIYSSGRTGITIAGGTSDSSNIFFADGTSGTAEYEGAIQFLHSSNTLAFGIGNSTAMKLDTNSNISLSNNDTSATGGGDSSSGNTIIGYLAGETLMASSNTGYQSVIIGHRAGESVTTGDNNLIIGNQTGKVITTSGANVFLGTHAGGSIAAGQTDTDGTIAIGYFAANQLTSAIKTVAIGYTAMQNQTTGNRNTVIGYGAMYTADGGEDFNVIIGSEAGYSINNDASHDNVLIGMNACQGGSGTFLGNIGIGSRVMNGVSNNSQTGTVAIGLDALYSLTSGEGNLAIGYKALDAEDDGDYTTGIGYEAFTDQTGTSGQVGNTGVGFKVGHELTSGMENTYLGMFAGRYNKTGNQNTYIGFLAGRGNSNQSNTGNTAVGNYAMAAISTGTQNVAVGSGSLRDISDGIRNTSVGAFSAHNVSSGLDNVAVGANSGFTLTTGDYNTAIGAYALYTEDIGRGTVAVGNAALYSQDSDSSDEITRNVGIGQESGHYNVTGQYNTYVGYRAGYGSSGNSHLSTVAIGTQALNGITTGNYNTAIGDRAGYTLTTTTSTVLIGFQAGYGLNSTDANGAVMIGYRAGSVASHPAGSTLIGSGSGGQITSGDSNTIVGSTAGSTITTGGGNTIVGQFACGFSGADLTGNYNTVMGYTAGQNLGGAANRNVIIGRNAGQTATTSSGSVFIGEEAGGDCTTGNQNIAIGQNAMAEGTTTGDGNISIGTSAGYNLTSGFMNVFIGNQAGEATNTATNNTAVGERAMHLNQTGNSNTAMGRSALENTTTATLNVALGGETMGGITSGIAIQDCVGVGYAAFKGSSSTTTGANGTVAIGRNALNGLTTGNGNVAIGYYSMAGGGTQNTSTAVGYATLQNSTSGMVGNTAIGYGVLDAANNSGADDNTGVGKEALGQLSSGAQNVAVGKDAGNVIQGGSNNVCIGKNANVSAAGASNQIAIGKDATGRGDNSAVLGNADVTAVYAAYDGQAKFYASDIKLSLNEGGASDGDGSGTGATVGLHISSSGVPYVKMTETNAASSGTADFEMYVANGTFTLYDVDDSASVFSVNTSQVISGDFNDTSDIGLKENIVSISEGLSIINQLNPVTFDWKKKSKGTNSGFIAQEVEKILPDDVSGTDYDESLEDLPPATVDNKGKSINLGGIVAHLTRAVQELSEKVESQQKEIEELKKT